MGGASTRGYAAAQALPASTLGGSLSFTPMDASASMGRRTLSPRQHAAAQALPASTVGEPFLDPSASTGGASTTFTPRGRSAAQALPASTLGGSLSFAPMDASVSMGAHTLSPRQHAAAQALPASTVVGGLSASASVRRHPQWVDASVNSETGMSRVATAALDEPTAAALRQATLSPRVRPQTQDFSTSPLSPSGRMSVWTIGEDDESAPTLSPRHQAAAQALPASTVMGGSLFAPDASVSFTPRHRAAAQALPASTVVGSALDALASIGVRDEEPALPASRACEVSARGASSQHAAPQGSLPSHRTPPNGSTREGSVVSYVAFADPPDPFAVTDPVRPPGDGVSESGNIEGDPPPEAPLDPTQMSFVSSTPARAAEGEDPAGVTLVGAPIEDTSASMRSASARAAAQALPPPPPTATVAPIPPGSQSDRMSPMDSFRGAGMSFRERAAAQSLPASTLECGSFHDPSASTITPQRSAAAQAVPLPPSTLAGDTILSGLMEDRSAAAQAVP
eukprot:Hpha_TRINITY_DN15192_c0_g1::TRINITY_DN15192_c0_g1_i9::g.130015::m.130015